MTDEARGHPTCRVRMDRGGGPGPLLVDGPVEVLLADGSTVASDRCVVALCLCGRSRIYPWCDTSHRARRPADREAAPPAGPAGPPGGADATRVTE